MNENIDYEFLILDELKSYRLYHTQEETIQYMRDIIEQNDGIYMSEIFKNIGKELLSEKLSRMVLKQINSDNKCKFDLTELLPSIIKNNIVIKEEKKKKNFVVPMIFVGALAITVSIAGIKCMKNKSNDSKMISNYKNEENISSGSAIKNLNVTPSAVVNCLKNNTSTLKVSKSVSKIEKKETVKKEKKIKKENADVDKKLILDDFGTIKSLKDIYQRKKELKSLNLTSEDKIYKKCKLDPAIQRFIYEQSVINGIPIDFLFSIIATESRGQWNSSGEESYNAPGNLDLGLTQQNTKSALVTFKEKFGLSYDDAYGLLKDDDYMNVVSCFLEIKEIASRFKEYDPVEYAGCYNGWLNWRNYSISQEYVSIFKKYYNNEFTKYHNIEKKKIKKIKVKVS